MNVQDVGKRCPDCTGLLGYHHDEGCPRTQRVGEYLRQRDTHREIARDAESRFYRGRGGVGESFAETQARIEAYRARPLEDRFVDMLTYEDKQLLNGMKIALNKIDQPN